MGPHFLTQPHRTQYRTNPTQPDAPIFWKDTTRPNSKSSSAPQHYFKCRLLFCMHVKIKTNARHKSEHRINIKLSLVTCGSWSHLASTLSIALLLPLC